MTPREDALYHLGIIEGCLHARGEDAYPVKIWHSLKMLKDALEIAPIIPHQQQEITSTQKIEITLPRITQMALDKAAAAAAQVVVDRPDDEPEHETGTQSHFPARPFLTSNEVKKQEVEQPLASAEQLPEKKPRRKMPPLSDERKASLRVKLEHARAVRAANKAQNILAVPPAPRVDSSADKLIDNHAGYAGERLGDVLEDSDWGDIQKMRINGAPEEVIIRRYNTTAEKLQIFTERMKKKDTADVETGYGEPTSYSGNSGNG